MSYVDKAALLAPPALDEDDVPVKGGEVRVRGLTRFEAGQVQKRTDTDGRDRLTMHYGLVNPKLTESEVGDWMQSGLAGDCVDVARRIAELSGLIETSGTDAYKSDGDDSGPGV